MNSVVSPNRSSIAHPLDDFYTRSGLVLPPLQQIDPEAVPEPYRRLLVHPNDMTSTLETFHGSRVRLDVLRREERDGSYFREVVLKLEENQKPVEFGAIRMYLGLFSPAAQALVLAEKWPLGRILKECDVPYVSSPIAFLRIASDRLINEVLHLSGAQLLYGRRNALLDPSGQPLADIVEILPPEKPPETRS